MYVGGNTRNEALGSYLLRIEGHPEAVAGIHHMLHVSDQCPSHCVRRDEEG